MRLDYDDNAEEFTPKKVVLASDSIVEKELLDHTGKSVTLGPDGVQSLPILSLEQEKYYRELRDIQIVPCTQEESLIFLQRQANSNEVTSSIPVEDIAELNLIKEEEDSIRELLVSKGFKIALISDTSTSTFIKKVSDIALIGEFTRRAGDNADLLKATKMALGNYVPSELKGLSYEELKVALANLGYEGLRPITKED